MCWRLSFSLTVVVRCSLFRMRCPLLVVCRLFRVVWCVLRDVLFLVVLCGLLFVGCGSLCGYCCLRLVLRYVLFVRCSLFFVMDCCVCWLLFVVDCWLFVVCCSCVVYIIMVWVDRCMWRRVSCWFCDVSWLSVEVVRCSLLLFVVLSLLGVVSGFVLFVVCGLCFRV